MKTIRTAYKFLAVLALAAFAASCASELEEKANLAVAAGFKIITPTNATQQSILTNLPPDKVTQVTYQGKIYFVLPDAKNNQAYVGGPTQYQSYRQLRLAKQLSNENLEAAQMNQAAAMNMGAYGGWGAVYPMGGAYYPRAGGFRR